MKKILLTFIIILLLTGVVACSGDDSGGILPRDETLDESDGIVEANDAQNEVPDEIVGRTPLPIEDFDGRHFNVITHHYDATMYFFNMFVSEGETGELINDALFRRRTQVEDTYNITINQITHNSPGDTARRSIMAGDDEFDLVVEIGWAAFPLANQRLVLNMHEIPFVSESLAQNQPWWDNAMTRDMTINGQLFFQAGDIIMADDMRIFLMLFNKDLFTNNNLDFPYQYVHDGTWTFERMFSLARGLNQDLTGDGTMGQDDQWGLVGEFAASGRLHQSAGERTIAIGADGFPYFAMENPRSMDVINTLMPYMLDGESIFMAESIQNPTTGNVYSECAVLFQDNRVFMWMTTLEHVILGNLRAMETDFGIIPTPKFNEAQENHYTFVEMSAAMVSVPITVSDLNFTGLILEALAYESVYTLTPAFYDLTLLTRTARDDESEAMLDIIFNNKIYDIGTFNTSLLVFDIFWAAVAQRRESMTSLIDERREAINIAIANFNADF